MDPAVHPDEGAPPPPPPRPKSRAKVTASGVIFTEAEGREGLRARREDQSPEPVREDVLSVARSEEQEQEESAGEAEDSEGESENVPMSEATLRPKKGKKRKAKGVSHGDVDPEDLRCAEHTDWPERDCLVCQEYVAALVRARAPVKGVGRKKSKKNAKSQPLEETAVDGKEGFFPPNRDKNDAEDKEKAAERLKRVLREQVVCQARTDQRPKSSEPKLLWWGQEVDAGVMERNSRATIHDLVKMQQEFDIHPAILEYFIDGLGIRNISEFRFAFEGEATAADFVKKVEDARDFTSARIWFPRREAAHLANAWLEAQRVHKRWRAEVDAPPDEADENDPVKPKEIQRMRERFWKRYMQDFGHDSQTPGDKTLSQVSRAVEKRTLKVPDLVKVTSIEDEGAATRVKKKVGHGLEFTIEETKTRVKKIFTLDQWLERLSLWTNALAIVGAQDVTDVPRDQWGERRAQKRGDAAHLFTQIPWQQMKDYVANLRRYAEGVHIGIRMEWIKARHQRVCEEACKTFRESDEKYFGECLAEASNLLIAIWQPSQAEKYGMRTHPSGRMGGNHKKYGNEQGSRSSEKGQHKGKGKGKGKGGKDSRRTHNKWQDKKNGGKGAPTLKNGEPVCAAWNEGKCTNPDDSCPNGKHVCNAYVTKDKRVCGMKNHRRSECTKVKY